LPGNESDEAVEIFEIKWTLRNNTETIESLPKYVQKQYTGYSCQLQQFIISLHFKEPALCTASPHLKHFLGCLTQLTVSELFKFEAACKAFHVIIFRKMARQLTKQSETTSTEMQFYCLTMTRFFGKVSNMMPDSLQSNRIGILFVFDGIISLQEEWIRQFLFSRLPKVNVPQFSQRVNEISEVQQYVGWAIQDCLAEWRRRVDPGHYKTLDTAGTLEITLILESM
jgi:hypothetical protein